MAQTRDMNSVIKLINFLLRDSLAAGTHYTKTIDLRAAITNSDLTEVVTRLQLALLVEFGAAGTIDINIEHSDNQTFGWVNLGSLAQASAADGEDFYYGEVYDVKQYIRLEIVVTGTVQTVAIVGNGDHGMRNPVVQLGTELTYTAA